MRRFRDALRFRHHQRRRDGGGRGALFALVAGVSLSRARTAGKIASRGWTFDRAQRPTGFWLVVATDLAILIGSVVVALHALGLIGSVPFTIGL